MGSCYEGIIFNIRKVFFDGKYSKYSETLGKYQPTGWEYLYTGGFQSRLINACQKLHTDPAWRKENAIDYLFRSLSVLYSMIHCVFQA